MDDSPKHLTDAEQAKERISKLEEEMCKIIETPKRT